MNKLNTETFKKLLLQQKREVLIESGKVDEGEIDTQSEELADVVDRSAMETDRNFTLRLLDRDRKLITKIDKALERIAEGIFGTCSECGDSIGANRLRARPVATLCIGCKEEQEEEESRS